MRPAQRTDRAAAPDAARGEPALWRVCGVTLTTPRGQAITRATARVEQDDRGWTALVTSLERPGVFATLYFVAGVRDVVLRLDDGREGAARITSTSFDASERICRLAGTGTLG